MNTRSESSERGLLAALTEPLRLGREFMKLWAGQTLSSTSDSVVGMALSIIVLRRTGSATAVSVGLLLQMLPALLVGPIAGVILDRTQRKKVMTVADAARCCASLLAAYAIHTGAFGLPHVYGWMAVSGVVRAFYDPATNALMPALVERDSIQRANAVHTVGKNTAMILGPAIAGLALGKAGDTLTLALGGLVFACAALIVWRVRPPYEERVAQSTKRPSLNEALEGFRFYKSVPLAMNLLVMAVFINFCAMPSGLAFQVHLLKALRAKPELLGLAFSVSAACSLVSSYTMAMKKRWPRLGLTMACGVGVMGISFASMGASRSLPHAYLTFALFGAATPFIQVPMSTLYQEITPPDLRGRVFALRFTISTFFSPISIPLVGLGLDKIGSSAVLLVLSALMGAVALFGLSSKVLREA